jgi:hypothetical protein
VDTGDLDGVSAAAGELVSDTDDNDDGLLGGLTMRETGVYRWTEEGVAKLWGPERPKCLADRRSGSEGRSNCRI